MSDNQTTPVESQHYAVAQERIDELRAMQPKIPNFVYPASKDDNRKMNAAAAVPPQFVESTIKATTNNPVLVHGGSAEPSETRDLVAFADAYEGFADELEILQQYVRHTVKAARNKAGHQALTTYSLAQRLAKRPEMAFLGAVVEIMSRALHGSRKRKASTPDGTPAPPPATTQTA